MASMSATILEPMEDVTPEQAYSVFDSAARHFLKMSGEDFLVAWKSGAFPDPDSTPGVLEVASLAPGLLDK